VNFPARLAFERESPTPGISPALLREVEVLSALRGYELDALARAATRVSCARGALISAAGNSTDAVHILLSGRVKISLKGAGREIILGVLGPGELIVEMDVLEESPASANVVALVACELILIDKRDFRRCVAGNSDMALRVVRELERRQRNAECLIGTLLGSDVLGRVLGLLRQAADSVNGRKVMRRKLSHQDIASRVGSSRVAVTQALKRLQLQGRVEIRDGCMIIHDEARAAPASVGDAPVTRSRAGCGSTRRSRRDPARSSG